TSRIRGFWRQMSLTDRLASAIVLIYLLLALAGAAQHRIPGLLLFRLLALLSLVYLVIRGLLQARTNWLWSLRRQLIAVYVFRAVTPLLLLLAMTALSFYLLDWHFGAYLVYSDLEERIEQVASTADTLTTAYALEMASTGAPAGKLTGPPPRTAIFLAAAQESLPGLKIELGTGQELLARAADPRPLRFSRLVANHDSLELRAVVQRRVNGLPLVVSASVPVTPGFVATMEPGLGPLETAIPRPPPHGHHPPLVF